MLWLVRETLIVSVVVAPTLLAASPLPVLAARSNAFRSSCASPLIRPRPFPLPHRMSHTLLDEERDEFLDIYRAARRGDAEGLAALLTNEDSVNTRFTVPAARRPPRPPRPSPAASPTAALTRACLANRCSDTCSARYCVRPSPAQNGNTPLIWVARLGLKDAAQLLLKNGADIEAVNTVRRRLPCTSTPSMLP